MGLLSKSKKDYEILVQENEELKNKLNRALDLHNSLEDLEFKVISTRKEIADLNQKEFESADKLHSVVSEIENKSKTLSKLNTEVKSLENNKADLSQKINIFQDKINNYQEKIGELELSLNNKVQQLGEIDSIETEKSTEFNEKQTELVELNNSLMNLHRDKEYLESEIISLQETMHSLRQENREVDDNYGSIKEEYNLLKVEVEELKTQLASFTTELRETEISVVRKRDMEGKLTESIEYLKQEDIKKTELIKELDNKILIKEEIKQSIEEALSGLTKQLAQKDSLYDEYLIRRDDLATQIIDNRKELANIELSINLKNEEVNKLNNEIEKHGNILNNIKAEYENYGPKTNEIQQHILHAKQEEELLLTKLADLKRVITDTENYKYETEQNYLQLESKLSETLESFNLNISEAKQKLNSVKQQVLEKEIDTNNKEKILSEKKSQIAEAEGKLRVAELEQKTMESIVNNLKTIKTGYEESIEKLKEKEFRIKSELSDTKNELSVVTDNKLELERNIKQLLDIHLKNINEYQEKNEALNNEINVSEVKLKELSLQVDIKTKEMNNCQDEVNDLKLKIEEYSGKAARLISMVKNETKQQEE